MKRKKLNLVSDDPQSKLLDPPEQREEETKRGNKPGRPTLLTPELWKKLIKLFEKHFFVSIVAASSNIYRFNIDNWIREQPDFHNSVTHAKDIWLKNKVKLLTEYAEDKRTKDWRALKYLLSIADQEFSDKKFLKDAPGTQGDTSITININQKELKLSKLEATRLIGEVQKKESISLLPFKDEKKPLKDTPTPTLD